MPRPFHWLRSFYWRIAATFVLVLIGVIAAQSAMFSIVMSRREAADPSRSPNTIANAAAAALGAALQQDRALDVGAYLRQHYARGPQSIIVVLRRSASPAGARAIGGAAASVASNGIGDLSPALVDAAEAMLTGASASASASTASTAPIAPAAPEKSSTPGPPDALSPPNTPAAADTGTPARATPPMARGGRQEARGFKGPVVTAPIQVDGDLQGLVLLPPPEQNMLREAGRWLSLPGTLLLILGTTSATLLAFAPARRRLRALEEATDRLARGDIAARAPEEGQDEIARVAQAFNRMTRELAARDAALRLSDERRRQMLADVSHELKTPLTSMRGYIETLQMPEIASDPERRARYFGTIARETQRLERLVNDLLDLARLESPGGAALHPQVFSVSRLFAQVLRRHEQAARTRRIAMTSAVADAAEQATGDPHRLDQVIDNLVVNALRHTPDEGHIALAAERQGAALTLTVSNSGEGIAPEHLPHVFERFYKAEASRAIAGATGAASAGSGLGLSIVRAIVEQHGGTASVASVPGDTRFTLTLPQSSELGT